MRRRQFGSLIFFIVLCLLVGLVGGLWTNHSVRTWYPTLVKPNWTPPGWVFGPVWTVLYLLIAFAGWLIYEAKPTPARMQALILWGIQLFLNLMWSFLFFFLRTPLLALVDILLLLVFIVSTIVRAWKVQPVASLLLIPYLLWVSFATALNVAIWWMNLNVSGF